MGMSGYLQLVAGRFGRSGRARLVRQQDAGLHSVRCAAQRPHRIALLIRIEMMGAEVGDAGQHQARTAMFQHHVRVHQHVHAHALQMRHPAFHARVVLVVAGDKKSAVARGQGRERFDVMRQVRHAAVDQVAGDRDDIRL